MAFMQIFGIFFGLALTVAFFAAMPIEERVGGSQHLHYVAGVKPIILWSAVYLWDFMIYLILVTLMIGINLMITDNALFKGRYLPASLTIFFLYGYCAIPCVYVLSRLFKSSVIAVQILFFIVQVIPFMACVMAETIYRYVMAEPDTADLLGTLFSPIPPYNFGMGMLKVATNSMLGQLSQEGKKLAKGT